MSDFHIASFMHISRSLNVQAHLLAKGSLISDKNIMHFTADADVIAYSNY